MTKYKLEIRPAVSIDVRHKIGNLLIQEGYNVWAQGQYTDESVCDINFETKETAQQMKSIKTKFHCSICGKTQFQTRSGLVCRNGHGGAYSIED